LSARVRRVVEALPVSVCPSLSMFERDLPKRKIGILSPLSVIDNGAYEFYRLGKGPVHLGMISVGLREVFGKDLERGFQPLDSSLDRLMDRGVAIVVQSGVPLPALIGVDAHDRLIAHISEYTGRPATSSVLGVVDAARSLGIKKIAFANKWSETMNTTLG